MKIYSAQTVLEATLDRLRWLFAEFPALVVNVSGGKDSTVLVQLALQVAAECDRLPLPVLFVDQEAEWGSVITYLRQLLADPRIAPYWLQVPMRLFNATSPMREPWLHCWAPGAAWIREKEGASQQENVFGTDRFHALFPAWKTWRFGDVPRCSLAGVRCEESPNRTLALTTAATYKGVTWAKREAKGQENYVFYPLYDWSYTDIWTAIHRHGWAYCGLYDRMYQYGVPVRQMRVSNVHHETAVKMLFFMQEVEPETWEALTRRLPGIRTAGQLQAEFLCPETLPFMFQSWREYRDYLLPLLVPDPAHQATLRRRFAQEEREYVAALYAQVMQLHVRVILKNDYHATTQRTFRAAHAQDRVRHWRHRQRGTPSIAAVVAAAPEGDG